MPAKPRAKTPANNKRRAPATSESPRTIKSDVNAALAALKKLSDKRVLADMPARYGIHTNKAFGVSMANMKSLAKRLGKSHELADALWDTGWYEARMVASMVDEPERVTPAQMDRWTRDCNNWGICDTVCFFLFDRSPHAFAKISKWSKWRGEFERRMAFALLACVALHGRFESDQQLIACLPLIKRGAEDERNFVMKGVSWALRAIGRQNAPLKAAALKLARELAESDSPSARWVGKDTLRDLGVKQARKA